MYRLNAPHQGTGVTCLLPAKYKCLHQEKVTLLLAGLALLACASLLLAAPSPVRLKFTQDVSVLKEHKEIRAVISAMGEDGHPLRGLTSTHFGITVDGQSARVVETAPVAANDRSIAMVLAIDISRSMAGNKAFEAARAAAARLIDQLASTDQVAVVSFGNTSTRILGFTTDKAKAKDSLKQLAAKDNRTVLYDGLLQSSKEASLATNGKAVVIAVTDGEDEGSNVTLEDIVANAKASGIAIYTLGFGPQEDGKTLVRISELTGGQYRHAIKPKQLPGLYQDILDELKDAYALRAEVQQLRPGAHTISVTLNYQGQKIAADNKIKIPPPRWIWMTILGGFVLIVLLSVLGWISTRRTRPQKTTVVEPARSPMWVDITGGPQRGWRVLLLGRSLRIGRAADCELQADDTQLASYQAEIVSERGGAVLRITGQGEAPTLLNGNHVHFGQDIRLRDGDRIESGAMAMVFADQRQSRTNSAQGEGNSYTPPNKSAAMHA